MKKIKKLTLNKETIARLSDEKLNDVKGGTINFNSTGCSDGCLSWGHTAFRCTHQNCTGDCSCIYD